MEEEWTIKLTRDEGLVLFDFLARWDETNADLGFVDSAEQAAIVNLFGSLETAEDGTAFRPDYNEQVAAARGRLREPLGGWLPGTGPQSEAD
jgi:hypothetical protein